MKKISRATLLEVCRLLEIDPADAIEIHISLTTVEVLTIHGVITEKVSTE
jgi:hypothetical protein